MFFSFPLYPGGGSHAQAHAAPGKCPVSHTAPQPSSYSPWSRGKRLWKHVVQCVPRLSLLHLTSLNLSVPSYKMGLLGG